MPIDVISVKSDIIYLNIAFLLHIIVARDEKFDLNIQMTFSDRFSFFILYNVFNSNQHHLIFAPEGNHS